MHVQICEAYGAGLLAAVLLCTLPCLEVHSNTIIGQNRYRRKAQERETVSGNKMEEK